MKGMSAFQKINDISDFLIAEAELPPVMITQPPAKRQGALARFFSSGVGVAILCGVVSFTVTFLIVLAGRNPNLPPVIPADSQSATEQVTQAIVEPETTCEEPITLSPPEETTAQEMFTEILTEKLTEKVTKPPKPVVTEPVTEPETEEETTIPVASVSLPEASYDLDVRDSFFLQATVMPQDATDPRVVFKSSNSNIVTVDELTGEIIALRKGTATITVTALSTDYFEEDPDTGEDIYMLKTATCHITVDDVVLPVTATQGLTYTWMGDYYTWTGMGESTEKDVVLPELVNGLPLQVIDLTYEALNDVGVESVTMSSSVDRIKSQAFIHSTALREVTFVDDIVLEHQAFLNCQALSTINGLEHIIEMQLGAFTHCAALESVTIYPTTTYGNLPFSGSGLKNVTFAEGMTTIPDALFRECFHLAVIELPATITTIGEQAFANTAITSIDLPEGLTSIGAFAFQSSDIVSITIPEGITTLESNLFHACLSLETVNLPSTLKHIGGNVFNNCSSLQRIDLPDGLESIGAGAFTSATKITSIHLPDSLRSIGSSCFSYCKSLENINLPEGIERIEEYTFNSCTALTSIELPKSLTYIGNMAFSHSSIERVHIPDSVSVINNSAFAYNQDLKQITFGENSQLTHLYDNVFCECTSLTSIVLPDSLTWLGTNAFRLCTSLESVYVSPNLTHLGSLAFSYCTALEYIYLPESLSVMASNSCTLPFNNCSDTLVVYTGMTNKPVYIQSPITVKTGYTYAQYVKETSITQ